MREQIVEVMRYDAVHAHPDDVVVTTGSQQALDLVTEIFIDPGDVIVAEAPSYVGALGVFRAYEADIALGSVSASGADSTITLARRGMSGDAIGQALAAKMHVGKVAASRGIARLGRERDVLPVETGRRWVRRVIVGIPLAALVTSPPMPPPTTATLRPANSSALT